LARTQVEVSASSSVAAAKVSTATGLREGGRKGAGVGCAI
jgi:hypothetical protein